MHRRQNRQSLDPEGRTYNSRNYRGLICTLKYFSVLNGEKFILHSVLDKRGSEK